MIANITMPVGRKLLTIWSQNQLTLWGHIIKNLFQNMHLFILCLPSFIVAPLFTATPIYISPHFYPCHPESEKFIKC